MATDLSSNKETLKQRIDKVISENQAIVETLNPLWSRRYMRQSSKDDDKGAGSPRGGRKYNMTSPPTLSKASTSTSTSTTSSLIIEPTSSIGVKAVPVSHSTLVAKPKSVTLEAHKEEIRNSTENPAELSNREPKPLMLVRQPEMTVVNSTAPLNLVLPPAPVAGAVSSSSKDPQSVREVWINSTKNKETNISQLEDVASRLVGGGTEFHPANPEGSMIKELLLKTRILGLTPLVGATLSSTSSASATVIELKSSTSTTASTSMTVVSPDPSRPTHIIYADPSSDPTGQQQPSPVPILSKKGATDGDKSGRSLQSGVNAEIHKKFHCNKITPELRGQQRDDSPLAKRPRLELPSGSAVLLHSGGSTAVRSNSLDQKPPGLLQIAQHDSIGIVTLSRQSTTAAFTDSLTKSSVEPIMHESIISTSAFTIPGIPTPSLSGVITGIKSTPLFSLPGKRWSTSATGGIQQEELDHPSQDKPVPYVLGMPGPFSQASANPTVHKSATLTPTTVESIEEQPSVSDTEKNIPVITVSPAAVTAPAADEIKVEVEKESSLSDPKFLRPSSLPLTPGTYRAKKQHIMLNSGGAGGATLVSPETPRPRKSIVLTYQNGTAYTHLGLKSSTRVYYCSVFRQQPMYVRHKAGLSMYSNWKVVSRDSHPSGLSPKESLASYNSGYKSSTNGALTVAAADRRVLTVAHSSQWRQKTPKEDEGKEKNSSKSEEEKLIQLGEKGTSQAATTDVSLSYIIRIKKDVSRQEGSLKTREMGRERFYVFLIVNISFILLCRARRYRIVQSPSPLWLLHQLLPPAQWREGTKLPTMMSTPMSEGGVEGGTSAIAVASDARSQAC